MPRVRQVLALEPGKVVADVGAGMGQLTIALAREVGTGGRVFTTEIDAALLKRLRATTVDAGLKNVTVIEGRSHESGLPPNCCDAIVVRRAYHHFTEPTRFNASLLQALRPGGVLAVIDFPPPFFWGRGELGVSAEDVVREVTSTGFKSVTVLDDWPGRGPLKNYCAVFQKPLAGSGAR